MSNKSQSPIVRAPEFNIDQWIDKNGIKTKPIKLSDFKGRFKVLLCFQSWCPGCHSKGLPHLKKMVEALEGSEKITFLAVQTVFEGYHTNTYQKIIDIQKHYNLKIPFGHDAAKNGQSKSQFMTNYKTGGTP
jgi:thiol-disulfide isomerase/thioredoxin